MKSHDWLQVRTIIEGVGWKSCYLSVDIVWIFFSQKCLNFCMWFSINLKTLSHNFLHSVWFALRFQEMLYAKKKPVFLAASFGDLLLHKKQNIFFVIGSIILSASWWCKQIMCCTGFEWHALYSQPVLISLISLLWFLDLTAEYKCNFLIKLARPMSKHGGHYHLEIICMYWHFFKLSMYNETCIYVFQMSKHKCCKQITSCSLIFVGTVS